MADYDNNNTGTLFKNDKKTTPNHPDYKGSAEIDHVEYWVSAWIKEAKSDGKKFMSLAYTPKDEGSPRSSKAPGKKKEEPEDEGLPF